MTCWTTPSSSHVVRMDSESLPTGIAMRNSRQTAATALTVSNSAASSPSTPLAAIQLADSRTRSSDGTAAAAILVIASPSASRPAAAGSVTATGVRSPIAIASPSYPSKSRQVTATSLTGTCHGPTFWSRVTRPPTVRSPM